DGGGVALLDRKIESAGVDLDEQLLAHAGAVQDEILSVDVDGVVELDAHDGSGIGAEGCKGEDADQEVSHTRHCIGAPAFSRPCKNSSACVTMTHATHCRGSARADKPVSADGGRVCVGRTSSSSDRRIRGGTGCCGAWL